MERPDSLQSGAGGQFELPSWTSEHLKELTLWAARSKGEDGLDTGYWQPWGPPCDLQELAQSQDVLCVFAQWVTRQLRNHRDAVAKLATTHQRLEEGLSADVDGKVDFASTIAMLTTMPGRVEAVEEQARTLKFRVDRLNDDLLKQQSNDFTAQRQPNRQPPSIRDKPADEAVKECRQAVGIMLEMQQSMQNELARTEENFSMRLEDFGSKLEAVANANTDAIYSLFQSRLQELEGLYSRCGSLEEGLEDLQQQALRTIVWKDDAFAGLAEQAKHLTDVEALVRALGGGLEELAQSLASHTATKQEEGEAAIAARTLSKLATVHAAPPDDAVQAAQDPESAKQGEGESNDAAGHALAAARTFSKVATVQDAGSDAAVQAAQDVADKAMAAAKKALFIAEEVRTNMSKIREETFDPKLMSWPLRTPARHGYLPYLPPSSLAQEERHRRMQSVNRNLVQSMTEQDDGQSPRSDPTDSERETDEQFQRKSRLKMRQAQTEVAKVLLQGEGPLAWQKGAEPEKERFLPPTGGCFRHQSPHSRFSSRTSRPLTAERPPTLQRGYAAGRA